MACKHLILMCNRTFVITPQGSVDSVMNAWNNCLRPAACTNLLSVTLSWVDLASCHLLQMDRCPDLGYDGDANLGNSWCWEDGGIQCDDCSFGVWPGWPDQDGFCIQWENLLEEDEEFLIVGGHEEWWGDEEDCPGGCGFRGTTAEMRGHECALLAKLREG